MRPGAKKWRCIVKKIGNVYNKLEEWLLVGSLLFSTVLLFIQVIMRSVFNSSLSWSEELARYIFIWQIWLGASITFREDKHIKVELLYVFAKSKRARAAVDFIANLALLAFCAAIVVIGFDYVGDMIARNALSPAMRIPLFWVYLSLPLSLFILSIRIIIREIQLCRVLFGAHAGIQQPGS